MSDVTKTYEWATSTGAKVTATAELTLSESLYADGWDCGERACCKYHFEIRVEGYGVVGWHIDRTPKTLNGKTYPASCGNLVISADHVAAIDEMVADVQQHPAYVAKMERERQAMLAEREYEDSTRRIRNAMAE